MSEPSMFQGHETFSTDFDPEWTGIEIFPAEVVYNPSMVDEQKDLIIEPGTHIGKTNYMALGKTEGGITTLNFIYRWQQSDGKWHGKIGPQVHLDNRNIADLIKLLANRLDQINSRNGDE